MEQYNNELTTRNGKQHELKRHQVELRVGGLYKYHADWKDYE